MVTTHLVNNSGTSDKIFMRGWATSLADYIFRYGKGVKGLELFGSIARGDTMTMDSDFDVIVCVSTMDALLWMLEVRRAVEDDVDLYNESLASVRRRKALECLGISPVDLEAAVGIQPWKQDFFLFPHDWRDLLDELQLLGHHSDPNFMRNIARDALTFVPNQGFAFSVFSW